MHVIPYRVLIIILQVKLIELTKNLTVILVGIAW